MLYYSMLCSATLYYAILCYSILYYTMLYYTIFDGAILGYTMLYYALLYYAILYYTPLYYAILCYTIKLSNLCIALLSSSSYLFNRRFIRDYLCYSTTIYYQCRMESNWWWTSRWVFWICQRYFNVVSVILAYLIWDTQW